MRRILPALVCLTLGATALAQPVSARSEAAVLLRGKTVFKTSTTASTLIRFPDGASAADLSYDLDADRGRIYGFVLRQVDLVPGETPGEVAVIGMDACTKAGCEGGNGFTMPASFGSAGGKVWRLYVIADSAPVSVTLALKGVAGRAHVKPPTPVEYDLRTLEPRVSIGPDATVVSVGAFSQLSEDPDFGIFQMWRRGGGHHGSVYGDCLYYALLPAPPEESAFLPGCPASFGAADNARIVQGDGKKGGPWFRTGSFGEVTGLGGWYATTAAPKRFGATAFWLAYTEDAD